MKAQETIIDGLHVQTYGDPGAPPVLMSAGLGGSGQYWLPQIAAFARAYFVVLYDHRGTARSDRSDLPPNYKVAHMAADIRAVFDGLGIESAHIVGHAAGGVAGLALAARLPDRLKSLTVVNGWVRASLHFKRCMEVRRDIFISGGANAYLKAQPVYLYPAGWIDQNLDHLDEERVSQVGSFQSAETLFARMEALKRFDLLQEGPAITTPTLLITSDDDLLVPASALMDLAQQIPSARLERLSSGGHAVNVTEPAKFNAVVLSFLGQFTEQ